MESGMKKKMMADPLLSVVVPFYNDEQYLKRCLSSLSEQSYDMRIEYILVDDGSTDGSPAIAETFRSRYPQRCRILRQENRGSGAARNIAIRQARGNYVGFVDADDWIEPGMFTQMLDTALHRNADVILCDFYKVVASGKKQRITFLHTGETGIVPEEHRSFVFESGFSPWNKLIRKELFMQNDLFFAERMLHQDVAVLPAVLAKSNKIINVSKPLYNYFVRPGSSVRSWNQNVYDIFKALDYLKARLPDSYDDEMEYLVIRELFYHVLPDQYRSGESYRQFFEEAVSYFLNHYPFWEENPYIAGDGRLHRLYLKRLLKNQEWPIALASKYKQLKAGGGGWRIR